MFIIMQILQNVHNVANFENVCNLRFLEFGSFLKFNIFFIQQLTQISAFELESSNSRPHLSVSITHSALVSPRVIASVCPKQAKGTTCRHFLESEDHNVALLQHNKLIWSREEALANIVAVEILELPMSDRDQTIETEFDNKEST